MYTNCLGLTQQTLKTRVCVNKSKRLDTMNFSIVEHTVDAMLLADVGILPQMAKVQILRSGFPTDLSEVVRA